MSNPCAALEAQVASLQAQRNNLSKQQAADLRDSPNKAATIAEYRQETKELDAKLKAARVKLEICQARRDVTVVGSELDGLEALDDEVRIFMRRNGVRAGQLTVLKGGWPILIHAYTNAPKPYPRTAPSSVFRIASCSKAFTCAAITQLKNDPKTKLSLATKVFPLLGIKPPPLGFYDKRLDSITVRHLVDHAGGWNCHATKMLGDGIIPGTKWDPVFHVRDIARSLGKATPPTKREIADYMYRQKLQFDPGEYDYSSSDGASYSNVGYVLLGLVVEKVAKKSFISYLRDHVLAPLGIKNVFVSPMLSKTKNALEVTYDDSGSGLTPFEPFAFEMVPNASGGEGFITELMDSGGGLMCSATSLATFIRQRAVWGLGGRATSARSGGMAGTASFACSRGDDMDWAFVFNTRHYKQAGDQADALATRLNARMTALKIEQPKLQLKLAPAA